MLTARLHAILRWLTVLLLGLALGAMALPARAPDAVTTPAALDSAAPATAPAAIGDAARRAAVVEANIFSDARRPPSVRYDPFAPEPGFAPAPAPEPGVPAPADDDGVPRLYGTLLGPGGALALMRLDPALPDAQLYREGDRVGPYRVGRITEQSVILDTSGGRIVLRLNR